MEGVKRLVPRSDRKVFHCNGPSLVRLATLGNQTRRGDVPVGSFTPVEDKVRSMGPTPMP